MYLHIYWRIHRTDWIQGLTLDDSEEQVLAFLADWRAAEMRELAALN